MSAAKKVELLELLAIDPFGQAIDPLTTRHPQRCLEPLGEMQEPVRHGGRDQRGRVVLPVEEHLPPPAVLGIDIGVIGFGCTIGM